MSTVIRSLAIVLAAWSFVPTAAARDYFVNNVAGNDAYDGTKEFVETDYVGPMRSIQCAIELLKPGDRLIIAKTDEPYREAISLAGPNIRGNGISPLVVVGNGATLDGSRPIDPRSWRHYQESVYRYEPRRKGPQMLFLDGAPAVRQRDAIPAEGPPTLEPLAWDRDWQFNYFRTEPNKLPETYNLSHAVHDVGITLYHARSVRVENLVIQGYRIDGVQFHDGTADAELTGCTIRGNGRSGVAVLNSSRAVVSDCLIGNNADAQVLAGGFSQTVLRACDLVEDGAPGIVKEGQAEVVVEEPAAE